MKVAVIHNLRHRSGDLRELFLLRAIRVFDRFVPVQLVLVSGELTVGNGAAEPDFLETLRASEKRFERKVPVLYLARPASVELPELPAEIETDRGRETPAALLERIRNAAGELPGFGEPPFNALVAELAADGSVRVECCPMVEPKVPGLIDFHVHTRVAYCSENMDVRKALEMARLSNLEALSFSEHSGQLYFSPELYWPGRGVWRDRAESGIPSRVPQLVGAWREGEGHGRFLRGFEIDVDGNGDALLEDSDRRLAQVRLGAVHHLSRKDDREAVKREFLFRTESLLRYGVQILAHPFRVFPFGLRQPVPEELFEPVAELLKRYGVAAEINFHHNNPEPEFFSLCVKKGVKLSFGSDSHNLYEVGFFLPHFRFLRELGVAGRLDEVLYRFPLS